MTNQIGCFGFVLLNETSRSELCESLPVLAVSLRQKRDGMDDAHWQVRFLRAIEDLEQAAGVGGGDDICTGTPNVLQLALQKVIRHLRLDEIVDPGASAAPGALRQLHQLQPWNRLKNLSG